VSGFGFIYAAVGGLTVISFIVMSRADLARKIVGLGVLYALVLLFLIVALGRIGGASAPEAAPSEPPTVEVRAEPEKAPPGLRTAPQSVDFHPKSATVPSLSPLRPSPARRNRGIGFL
jgi:hypothetical protein